MKKWLILFVSLTMLFSVTACGGTKSASSDPTAQTSASLTANQSQETSGSDHAVPVKGKLTFWDMPWGDSQYTVEAKKLVAQYTKETGQQVEYQQIPWDGWIQTFITAASSNSGPDINTGGALLQHRLEMMNEIEPLDDLVATYSKDDFAPGTLENFRANGKQIAIPYNCDFRAIYYRTDLFEKAGIKHLPTTWDEFYDVAKKLSHGDQYGYVTAGADSEGHWSVMFWSVSNGGSYLDSNMKPNMNNKANIETLDFLRKMYNDKLIPPGAASYTIADAQKLFYQGKAAMIMGAPDIGAQVPADVKDVVSIMPPIKSPAGLTQNVGSTNGIMIMSDSKYKEQGKAFLDWFSKNSLSLWTKGGQGPLPARLSLLKDPFFQNDKFKKLFSDLIVPQTVLLTYPHKSASVEMDIMDGEQFYRDVIQKVYTTKEDSQSILKEADARYTKALEQLKSSAN